MLLISIASTAVSFTLLGLAEPLGIWVAGIGPGTLTASSGALAWVFFSRVLDGLAGGNVSLARAYITDITDEHVTLDANHPLAGQTLYFEVELVDIV